MSKNRRLKKIQTIESENFIITTTVSDKGRLKVEIGSEDGCACDLKDLDTSKAPIKATFTTRKIEVG